MTLEGVDTATPQFVAPLIDAGGSNVTVAFTFRLTVTDAFAAKDCGVPLASSSEVTVTVENVDHPPTASAGPARTVNEEMLVELDGSGSSDLDGDALAYGWQQIAGTPVNLTAANTALLSFTAPTQPAHQQETLVFGLTVADGYLLQSSATVEVTVQDVDAPPDCSLAHPNAEVLWPPNHEMFPVRLLGVTDPDDPVAILVTAVRQDEPTSGLGEGDTPIDALLNGDGTVLLRAERVGARNGRVYSIDFIADDGFGGTCVGTVTVAVPKSAAGAAVDEGPLFDSTAP